jgi:hypothetical protein
LKISANVAIAMTCGIAQNRKTSGFFKEDMYFKQSGICCKAFKIKLFKQSNDFSFDGLSANHDNFDANFSHI